MATYTSYQLHGAGALNTDQFNNTGETPVIRLKITLPGISAADRNHADVGQCALFIETLNLGTNPTVAAREINPPFGLNPTVNYMEAGYSGGNLNKNIVAEEGSYGFFPQQPTFLGFEQTITFESLGIQHNLSKVPGSVASPEPLATGPLFERYYLSQKVEELNTAAFTFTNNNIAQDSPFSFLFYWFPSNPVTKYGDDGEGTFFYGSVRFRGVGNFTLDTSAVPLVAG